MNHAHSKSMFVGSVLLVAAFTGACRGGEGDTDAGGGGEGGGPPLSDATSLECPAPGHLPFATETNGFADDDNRLTAEGSPRYKDESSDVLGVPGGPRVNTYIAVDAASGTSDPPYDGAKARTGQNSGLGSVPLYQEAVSLWFYDEAATSWTTLGRAKTDDLGKYSIPDGGELAVAPGQPVYSVLEADGSCAEHYEYLLPEGTKVVVTDIDGTLTLSDEELFKQIDDGAYVPLQNQSAQALMSAWVDKGYVVVYLTARPHLFRSETRAWMEHEGFPVGPVITANSLVFDESARVYKRSWLNRVLDDFHWDVVAAYGNAESDIDAYEDAGVPKDITFIVGEFAGANGTQPIDGNDYTTHISEFVAAQPDAN
ncbi:MAG: hypothetical protein HOW73_33360 [Polyangiaceae bacterium]|nr:hypothetical protein [Polyangiaceae bacterium]